MHTSRIWQGVHIIATNPTPPTRLITHTPEEFQALQIQFVCYKMYVVLGEI
jgi:hypothetical protein